MVTVQKWMLDKNFPEPAELLKALDYGDELTPTFRSYYVCVRLTQWRTRRCTNIECALAPPAKLRRHKGIGAIGNDNRRLTYGQKHSWRCDAVWGYLHLEAQLKPKLREAKAYWGLVAKFDNDYRKLPQVGCGSAFYPLRNGPSTVVEIKIALPGGKEEWKAFMAEHMPDVLDLQFKKIKLKHVKELRGAMNSASAQEVFDLAPMTLPMTHTHHLPDGAPLPMVARYPVADWKEKGEPYMTAAGWAKLCVAIARKDT